MSEFTLINGRCMVYGHLWTDKGYCDRINCGATNENYTGDPKIIVKGD